MKNILILIIAGLSVMGCHKSDNEKAVLIKEEPVEVTAKTVAAAGNDTYEEFSAVVKAKDLAQISTRYTGYINEILFETGDKVRKGETVVKINATDLQAKLSQVEANIKEAGAMLKSAQTNYERFSKLYNSKSATLKEFEDVSTQYEMAKAKVEALNEAKSEIVSQFSYTNIKAPLTGTIVQKNMNEGDLATPGMPILSIESTGELELEARIPESRIGQVKEGDRVDIVIKSSGQVFKGQISELSLSALNTGGQYLAKVEILDSYEGLLSGMYAKLRMQMDSGSKSEVISVEKEALVKQGQLTGLYVITEDNKALLRWMRLGRDMGPEVEVLSGLKEGERYVASSSSKLYNGVPVISK